MKMTLYVESSALSAILLEGDDRVAAEIKMASEGIVTSVLTLLETRVALRRAAAECRIDRSAFKTADKQLIAFRDRANLLDMDDRVLKDAEKPFPVEPIRTLDAIHLATIRLWSGKYGPVAVASHDRCVRANAVALGIRVVP